jgi:aminoglycoside phosphotransferase (APT) family kinase protein
MDAATSAASAKLRAHHHRDLGDQELPRRRRHARLANARHSPDAAHMIFLKDVKTFSGNFLIDDTFLFANGVRDFDRYRVDPGVDLEPDFFVPDDPPPVSLKKAAG